MATRKSTRKCAIDGCDAILTGRRWRYCSPEHARAGTAMGQRQQRSSLRGRITTAAWRASSPVYGYGAPRLDRRDRIAIAVRLATLFLSRTRVSGRVVDMEVLRAHFNRASATQRGRDRPTPYSAHCDVIDMLVTAGAMGVDGDVFDKSGEYPYRLCKYVDQLRRAGIKIRLSRRYIIEEQDLRNATEAIEN